MTFSLDQATIRHLSDAAERLSRSKSKIVREAIAAYHPLPERLSEAEKQRMLKLLRDFAKTPVTGSRAEADAELAEIRRARRHGGRRHRY